MARAPHRAARAVLSLLLTSSAAAHADQPAHPALSASSASFAAPPASSAPLAAPVPAASSSPPHRDTDIFCDDAIVAWTERASRRTGLTITPASCPLGLVRLEVAGAGCDFEVSRDHGFQRTANGAFAVSPIVDLDWSTAPESMKRALTGILSALAEDASLPMGSNTRRSPVLLGSRRNQIGAGAALVVLLAAAFALWRRRRLAARGAVTSSPQDS